MKTFSGYDNKAIARAARSGKHSEDECQKICANCAKIAFCCRLEGLRDKPRVEVRKKL